jgi:murein L,D-transpeptidase YcbB/YkuD
VPLSLKMQDFKPKLVNDPGYLHEKGIQVYRNGRTMDPHSIDWASVSSSEMNQLRFTQRPGDHNALGKIRILMPSDYDIYLHDTNHPEFFEKAQRALSSGCIRLSDPRAVAKFVLKHNADFSDEKMEELIERGKLVEVNATAPFPVYIVYQSVWLDDSGELVFGADIYKQDDKLIAALKREDGFALPKPEDSDLAQGATVEKPDLASAQ